jgi:hypothetical protein
MGKKPIAAITAEILILMNALVWLTFTGLIAMDLHPALPDSAATIWVMGILAFGCAGALVVLAVMLGKRFRIAYYPTLGLLALLAVLTIADDFGFPDLIYLALVTAPLLLLIRNRSWYLKKS